MEYTPFPLSERIKNLKESYKSLPVVRDAYAVGHHPQFKIFCSGDRWISLGFLRGYFKYMRAETTRLRTSYAEAQELYEAQPVFLEDELLAGHLYLPEYTKEEKEEYDRLCEMYKMSPQPLFGRGPRKDHIALDYHKLLKLGINGILEEIENKISQIDFYAENTYPEYEPVKKYEFYRCLKIELCAVLDLAKRYSEAAKKEAEKYEGERKRELLNISRILEKVPANPAETFYEAMQSVHFFTSNLFGLFALGRPDRYLLEFYEHDIQNGTLTRCLAQELIDNFCLGVTDRTFSRSACGFMVGGTDKDGALVENELTYMFLTSLDHLRTPDPNGALSVCEKTSDDILRYCAKILSNGTTHPAFFNDTQIINSLIKNYGVLPEDAANYIHTTCSEISVIGKSKCYTTSFNANLPAYLLSVAFENENCESFDELFEKYLLKIEDHLKSESIAYLTRMLEGARVGNDQMRICALVDDCIEKGKSIYEGGERYMLIQPHLIGFSTAVDSLYAIKTLVYEEKKLTLSRFCEIVKNDFKGEELLRQYIINKLPHYGNDCEDVDKIADRLSCGFEEIRKKLPPRAKNVTIGTFSYNAHGVQGAAAGATFDGRRAGYSYSDGCSPAQGRDKNGPTAMVKSLSSFDQSTFMGGMVVNIKFGKESILRNDCSGFVSVIKTFLKRGGIQIQANVVSRETLKRARENPQEYSNLIVRVGGFSDYYVRLTEALKQELIDRTEY